MNSCLFSSEGIVVLVDFNWNTKECCTLINYNTAFASMEMNVSNVWGLRTTRCQEVMFLTQRSWTNLHTRPLDFLTSKVRVLQEVVLRARTCNLLLWALYLEGLLIQYWLILGRDFEGSIWILTGGALCILLTSVGDFAYKKSSSWFNRNKANLLWI